jgi:hypothetical protein
VEEAPAVTAARLTVLAAIVASVALLGTYLALGGAEYEPLQVANPCEPRDIEKVEGVEAVAERIALSALDGAACELRVTREELAVALASERGREEFGRAHAVTEERFEDAIRAGLDRAIDDARRTDQISGIEAALLREAAQRVPADVLVDALQEAEEAGLLGLLTDLLQR